MARNHAAPRRWGAAGTQLENCPLWHPTSAEFSSWNLFKRHGHDGALIEVRDQGIGLAAKDQQRIFERFYRVDMENVRRRPGTGLGLFVVSALVRSLGGRVRASSGGPGQGTCMQVTLPRSVP